MVTADKEHADLQWISATIQMMLKIATKKQLVFYYLTKSGTIH